MRPLLLVALLTLLAPALAPAAEAQDAGGSFRVIVRAIAGEFGPEKWKEEQAVTGDLGKNSPLPAVPNFIGTYKNPYFDGRPRQLPAGPVNAWGHALNLTLELVDAKGAPIKDPELTFHIEARIPTSQGDIPAKLTKLGPTTFRALFDLDGEVGKAFPALLGGSVSVAIDVYQQPPTAQRQKVAQDAIAIRTTYAPSSIPAVQFPRDALQIYSDLGNVTPLAVGTFAPTTPITASFAFGVPNATARGLLVNNRAVKTVFEGKTDQTGAITITAKPSDVLQGAEGGLVVLEAHLLGSPSQLTVGNGLVIIPVSSHATAITSIIREVRTNDADPAATIRVTVGDPDATPQAGGRQGRVLALDGLKVLASVPFLPAEPGTADVTHKYARYLARDIIAAKVSSYTLYSLLFTEKNEFYSIADATRGYTIGAAPVLLTEGDTGVLRLSLRNLNENGDAQADPGLGSTVRVRVTGLPAGANWTGEAFLEEGSVKVLEVPFDAADSGTFKVIVNSTADELRLDRTATIKIEAPPGALDGFLDRLTPGPGVGLLAALGALAACIVRRRR